jgi:tetratricopeptide (TPR) repeat protein/DNA-binding MarR family transcriptional regulator
MGAQTYLPIEILDYVETHAPPEDSTFGVSQRELAKVLGYHPCSMSRPLNDLVTEGLLGVRRAPVRDGIRKQLTYRITESGRSRLRRETKEVPLVSGEMPPPPHPFLGRKEELNQLAEFSREAGSVTFVDGAPGMGKTALVARHLRRVKQGRIPFWFTVRSSVSPRQFVSALSHALSFLGAQQLAYYAQLPRPPMPRETADLVARAVNDRALAVVVDDMQMGGTDMRRFLQEFVESLVRNKDHQFFFVGQDPPFFEPKSIPSHRVTIGGLDRAAAHELTDRQGGLADRFESVYQSSLGSPLLLQLAVSNPGVEADANSLPSAVVRRLPPEEIRAMLPVVLANEPLPATFVSESEALQSNRLAELTRMGILHRTLQGRVEVLQVVRAALLARVAPSDEREAHLRLVKFYSRTRRPEAVRERFLHLVDGESWKPAAQLLAQQERIILRLGYSDTLRNAFRHLAAVLPSGPARVHVLQAEANLLRTHSDYSEAIASLRKAVAESSDEPRTACECLLSIVELYLRLPDLDQAEKELTSAQRIGPISRRLQAYFALTEGRMNEAKGNYLLANERYETAFELARRFKNTDLALESIAAWSRLEERQSGPEVALRLVAAALPEARQANRPDIVFNLLLVRAHAYVRTGQEGLAETDLKLIRAEAEALGYVNQLAHALSGLAATAANAGRWSEAMGYAKQASTLAERLGNDLVLGHTLGLLCSIELRPALASGDRSLTEDAIAHGKMSVEVLNRIAPTDSLVLAHGYLAEVYAFRNERESAVEHYQTALQLADKLEMNWLRDYLVSDVGVKIRALTEGVKAPASAEPVASHVS